MASPTDLTQSLQSEVGDALRIVAVYAETVFDHLYLRDDLEPRYSSAELETLRREIIVFALGKETVEEVTHAGPLQNIIYETDDAFSLQFPFDGYTGVFVSIDSSAKTQLFDVSDTIREWVNHR